MRREQLTFIKTDRKRDAWLIPQGYELSFTYLINLVLTSAAMFTCLLYNKTVKVSS